MRMRMESLAAFWRQPENVGRHHWHCEGKYAAKPSRAHDSPKKVVRMLDGDSRVDRLYRAVLKVETCNPEKPFEIAQAAWETVVPCSTSDGTDVEIACPLRKPAQQREAEMRLDKSPLVGRSKIHRTPRTHDSLDLSKMIYLRCLISHMFDDVIGNHQIERLIIERQTGALDEIEAIALEFDPAVHHIDRIDGLLLPPQLEQSMSDDSRAAANLENSLTLQEPVMADDSHDLSGFERPAAPIDAC